MATSANSSDRRGLRRKLRQQRRDLPLPIRTKAEMAVTRGLLCHPWFLRARNIAVYMAFDGELDVGLIHHAASRRGKQVFVPKLGRGPGGMAFVHADTGDAPTTLNQFGIREPLAGLRAEPRSLDLVLAPLVAFDTNGTRLGMGGGHYDRLFSFLSARRIWRHPKLLGVGFELQRRDALPREPWDVMLHGVITERRRYFFTQGDH